MKFIRHIRFILVLLVSMMAMKLSATNMDSLYYEAMQPLELPEVDLLDTSRVVPPLMPDTTHAAELALGGARGTRVSIYDLPYSVTGHNYNWPRLWTNTGVLVGAFTGTLLVLECLPEDATTWNRAEIRNVPLGERWVDHVIHKGPEWDHDRFIFNYVLHPYAGAVYYMSARSCGFNAWQSLLYCTIISDVGWEFGIEAFMEQPSYQDLFITPLVGSLIGEGFYKTKRYLVDNDYCLFGSRVLGNIVAFIVDPVNEVVGLFGHNDAREVSRRKASSKASSSKVEMTLTPMITPHFKGLTFSAVF